MVKRTFRRNKKSNNIAAVYGKQYPMPGSSIQNLIDLDIIFKDQPIIYKKDPYFNNANSIYNAKILKKIFLILN